MQRAPATLRGENYFFFFFAFFLADFLAAFFFLATVHPPLKSSSRVCLPAIFDGRSANKSQTTQPTTLHHALRRVGTTIRSTNANLLKTKCVNVVTDICTRRKYFCNTIF